MKKNLLLVSLSFLTVFNLISQNVLIPDVNFKNYLLGNSSINTNNDSEIQLLEAQAFTGGIYCGSSNISDLTGIEAFTSLTVLSCWNNNLTNLNLTNNTSLTQLSCGVNLFTSLDLSNNTLLEILNVGSTGNGLLNSINISNCVSLVDFRCMANQLTELDVSNCPNLSYFDCSGNNLMSLNLANGNNSNLSTLYTYNNPNLTCIQVDDANYSSSNWTSGNFLLNNGVNFSTDCASLCVITIPDINFKNYLIGNSLININNDSEIQCNEASNYTGQIVCTNLNISDLTGIEAFTNLTYLNCNDNQISTIDLSSNTELIQFYASNNSLTSLVANNNPNITHFKCGTNQLTQIDLSSLTDLEILNCENNQISTINVSSNNNLNQLFCFNNQLNSLNIKNGNNINFIALQTFGNSDLSCIEIDAADTTNYNWNGNGNFQFDSNINFSQNCASASLIDNTINNNFKIYPNPTNGEINIVTNKELSIRIFNVVGHEVYSDTLSIGQNTINLIHLNKGVYFILDSSHLIHKVVIE